MTDAPLIGIVPTAREIDDVLVDKAAAAYSIAVTEAGGVPLILPNIATLIPTYAELVDGLVLAGGDNDIHPACYGEEVTHARGMRREKDAVDLAWVTLAVARQIPTLGVCRGMQAINVALGGSLVQHIDDHLFDDQHLDEIHTVTTLGSRVVSAGTYGVNSIHHQVVGRIAPGLAVVARAEDDVIEMVEHETLPLIGVQWHPEFLLASDLTRQLFRWLADAAHARRISHLR